MGIGRASALAVATFPLTGCVLEQILIGQVYTIQAPPAGACPRLQWQFAGGPDRSIQGSLSSDGQQQDANPSGLLAADDGDGIGQDSGPCTYCLFAASSRRCRSCGLACAEQTTFDYSCPDNPGAWIACTASALARSARP